MVQEFLVTYCFYFYYIKIPHALGFYLTISHVLFVARDPSKTCFKLVIRMENRYHSPLSNLFSIADANHSLANCSTADVYVTVSIAERYEHIVNTVLVTIQPVGYLFILPEGN